MISSTAAPTAIASGLPPKVVPCVPAVIPAAASRVARHAPTGKPAPSPLASVAMSGAMPGPFVREEAAGAAHAGLDLVEDQKQPVLVAKLAQVAQVFQRHGPDAALALDRLDQDRGGLRRDRRLKRLAVAERHLVEALDLRPEAFQVFLLAAGGDGRERAAVEGALERDDAEALRRAASHNGSAAPS